jgi:hypothetical protein
MSKQTQAKLAPKQRLERMLEFVKIAGIESCLQIYSYLLLFGLTTPAKLRDVTSLSKATMFRNLALLSKAGILAKEEIDSTPDKRYRLHYYIENDLVKQMKAIYSKDVEEYAGERGKLDLLMNYGRALEGLPLELNRISNELILHCPEDAADADESACLVVRKMLSFQVGEADDLESLMEEVTKLVKAFESTKSGGRRNMKKPLKKPVVMSISLAVIDTEESTIPEDALALRYKGR